MVAGRPPRTVVHPCPVEGPGNGATGAGGVAGDGPLRSQSPDRDNVDAVLAAIGYRAYQAFYQNTNLLPTEIRIFLLRESESHGSQNPNLTTEEIRIPDLANYELHRCGNVDIPASEIRMPRCRELEFTPRSPRSGRSRTTHIRRLLVRHERKQCKPLVLDEKKPSKPLVLDERKGGKLLVQDENYDYP